MSRSRVSVLALLAAFLLFMSGCTTTTSNSNSRGTAPSITSQPVNATVTVGQTATFSVGATGASPLNYQWRRNAVNISGAAASTYTTPATTSSDSGAKFDVVVSNADGSMTSNAAILTVTAAEVTLQSIAVTPLSPSIAAGNTQQFTATGTYSDNSTKNITGSVTWASSNPLFATIASTTGLATGVALGTTEITATLGSVVSPNDPLTVAVTSSNASDVVTHHYDAMRSGTNTHELTLTPTSVHSTTFGKVAEFAVDGQIDGQILFLNQVAIPGVGNKNVLYFATENDSVYAVDADSVSGTTATVLWKTRMLPAGDVPLSPSDAGCGYINPVGIMSTPVIDRSRNAIYVVASSKDSSGNVSHRLHALDLTTGAELFGGPTTITATYPKSSGGTVTFLPKLQQERAALLESGGRIYTAWSGYYGDCGSYSGWVIAFSADTLAQVGAIDLVPNSGRGGIWLGGGGPAADAAGSVYLSTGNASTGNTPGISNDYGDTFVKLSGSAPVTVVDYFAPSNAIVNDGADADLGSAAALLLPDLVDSGGVTRHLSVVAGKDGAMYVVDRDNLGQYSALANNVYQAVASDGHENFSSPIYFNGQVYIGPSGLPLKAFSVSQAKLSASPSSQTAFTFGSSGTVPSASANGTTNGIVWALDRESRTLYAYDATDLTKVLYDTSQAAGGRDSFSNVGGHFITPMVANGKVYFGTGTTVVVFGLLP
jgi:Bacterial Ig-like domain (group 2)